MSCTQTSHEIETNLNLYKINWDSMQMLKLSPEKKTGLPTWTTIWKPQEFEPKSTMDGHRFSNPGYLQTPIRLGMYIFFIFSSCGDVERLPLLFLVKVSWKIMWKTDNNKIRMKYWNEESLTRKRVDSHRNDSKHAFDIFRLRLVIWSFRFDATHLGNSNNSVRIRHGDLGHHLLVCRAQSTGDIVRVVGAVRLLIHSWMLIIIAFLLLLTTILLDDSR